MGIIIVIVLSLWSITKTLEKLADRVLASHKQQNELLEAIKTKLEEKAIILVKKTWCFTSKSKAFFFFNHIKLNKASIPHKHQNEFLDIFVRLKV